MRIEKYGATWCGPCRILDKTLDEFEKKHPEVTVNRYDIDEIDHLDALNITQVPVLRFMKEHTEVSRLIGAVSIEAIEHELSKENA